MSTTEYVNNCAQRWHETGIEDILECPKCGQQPKKTDTRYGERYDCCGLWAWGISRLCDKATHDARWQAHQSFDQLWMYGAYTRSEAYKKLAKELGIELEDCHMKLMDRKTAERVPAIALKMKFDKRLF